MPLFDINELPTWDQDPEAYVAAVTNYDSLSYLPGINEVLRAQAKVLNIGQVTLTACAHRGGDFHSVQYVDDHHYSFSLLDHHPDGAIVAFGKDTKAHGAILAMPGNEFSIQTVHTAAGIRILIPRLLLNTALAEVGLSLQGGSHGDALIWPVGSPALSRFRVLMESLFAGSGGDLDETELIDEIIGMIGEAVSFNHLYGEEKFQGLALSAARILSRQMDQAVDIESMAESLGTGRRSLEMAFRKVFHTSIARRHREIRLFAVYRRLLNGEASYGDIIDLAKSHGFNHASRFSALFHRQFGIMPRELVLQDVRVPTSRPPLRQ